MNYAKCYFRATAKAFARRSAYAAGSLLLQHLEGVRPVVPEEARDAPEHAERLDRAGRLDAAHVLRLPAELGEDRRDLDLGRGAVAADEHGGLGPPEVGVDHERVPDGRERLHEVRLRRELLEALHEGLVHRREVLEDALRRRAV